MTNTTFEANIYSKYIIFLIVGLNLINRSTLVLTRDNQLWQVSVGAFRPEDAGGGDQAGPDGRRHGRHGRADGQGHPGQAGAHWRGQQVNTATQNELIVMLECTGA